MVENLHSPPSSASSNPPPPMLGSARPRFSFVAGANEKKPARNATVSAYRLTVTAEGAAAPVWDSGKVVCSDAGTNAIRYGGSSGLAPHTSWRWTAEFWPGHGGPSPQATGWFETGPLTAADWQGSWWLGGGQNEFELRLAARPPAGLSTTPAAAPGQTAR